MSHLDGEPNNKKARTESESKEFRRPFIGGNWKCNGSKKFLETHIAALNSAAKSISSDVEVVVSPTSLHLQYTMDHLKAPYQIAAQNCSAFGAGAYTGEVSAAMVKEWGLPWVIIGHSERRTLFHETDVDVAKKVALTQKEGLSTIACIGETLDQRKAGKTFDVVFTQLQAISGSVGDWTKVVIAYEPVWAIGTGVVATPEQAQEVHAGLRKWLREKVGPEVAYSVRIIYGGSVKSDNCVDLMGLKDVDGFLVGGASLVDKDFLTIVASPVRVGRAK